jgi:hypothetical protein
MKTALAWIGAASAVLVLSVSVTLLALYATAPGPREADGWRTLAPLPEPRGELATAVAHASPCPVAPCPEAERLYVLGGLSGLGRIRDDVSIYDPTGGAWSAGPPLPRPRHHLGAAGLGQAIYAGGGASHMARPWTPERDFWRLEVGAGEWELLEPMPEPRWGHRLVAHDGRLFVVGGAGPTSRVLIYAPAEGWRAGAEMPVPRDHLSAVAVEGRIWAIGGRVPESLARVDIYDPATDTWTAGPALPAPTSGAAEGVVDGVILVYAGEEMKTWGGEVYDRHWMLDSRSADPRWVPAPPPPLPVHGADGAVFQGTMVIAGGAGRHGALSVTAWTDVVQRLNPDALAGAGR